MIQNSVLKGTFLVGLGAISYGMLATFVKLAYKEGFTTAEITISQFVYGILGVFILHLYDKNKPQKTTKKASTKSKIQLIIAGTSLGLTSVFYYLCVKFIDVSIAIVLLMQTVWMGVLFEWFFDKKTPSFKKIVAVIIVVFGTLLATNVFKSNVQIDWKGFVFGLIAALSFTITMVSSNKIALQASSAQRSLYMLYGGAMVALIFAILMQQNSFNIHIFLKYGFFLALFGTIIPPVLMNAGFPLCGIGLGSIVSALELPVSVVMAFFILNEQVTALQWTGIVLILISIIIMNTNFVIKKKLS